LSRKIIKFFPALTYHLLVGSTDNSLRHTFATRLVMDKRDICTVSKLLGHADIRTSMIYAKHDVESLRGAVETIEDGENLVTREIGGEENC